MQCIKCGMLHTTSRAECFSCEYQKCKQCKKYFEKCAFKSHFSRRTKLTVNCLTCRAKTSYTRRCGTSKTAVCRQYYMQWQKNNNCTKCGTTNFIQADHINPILKIQSCSNYSFFGSNGGIKALEQELNKCQALCIMCHRLKTKDDFELTRTFYRPSRTRNYKVITSEKLKRKCCHVCHLEITNFNSVCFDFNHRKKKKKLCKISEFTVKSQDFFDTYFQKELLKCDLLCAKCHHKKTHKIKK